MIDVSARDGGRFLDLRRHGIRRALRKPMVWRLPLVDVALALGFTIWAVVEESSLTTSGTARPWDVVAAVVWTLSLLFRSVSPALMAALAIGATVGYALVPGAPDWAPFEASLVVYFFIGSSLRGAHRWAASVCAAVSVCLLQVLTSPRDDPFLVAASGLVILGGPVLAGALLQRSRDQGVALRVAAQELRVEREARARDAEAAERNRIARELHDVISHSVSLMVVQAGAAEQQLTRESPAREQLRAVRQTGRDTLSELRRQLTVLRGPTS